MHEMWQRELKMLDVRMCPNFNLKNFMETANQKQIYTSRYTFMYNVYTHKRERNPNITLKIVTQSQ